MVARVKLKSICISNVLDRPPFFTTYPAARTDNKYKHKTIQGCFEMTRFVDIHMSTTYQPILLIYNNGKINWRTLQIFTLTPGHWPGILFGFGF